MGALSQVGVPITRPEADEVIAHYSDKGDDRSIRTDSAFMGGGLDGTQAMIIGSRASWKYGEFAL